MYFSLAIYRYIGPNALTTAVVWLVAGIVVAITIDGALYTATDFSAAQWYSIGVKYLTCSYKSNFKVDPDNGRTSCTRPPGGGSGAF